MTSQVVFERTTRSGYFAGARTALPYVVVYAPFGLAIGALAHQSAVSDLLGWSTSWLTYAGTSQLVLIQMLDVSAAPVSIIAAILLINVRLVGYSTALTPGWRTAPRWWTALASYVLVDPAYVIATEARSDERSSRSVRWHRQYYLGAAGTMWATWLVICGAGVLLGTTVGDLIPATVLADLMLVSMVVILAQDRGTRVAAAAGLSFGIPAVLAPGGLGVTIATLLAVAVAAATTRKTS